MSFAVIWGCLRLFAVVCGMNRDFLPLLAVICGMNKGHLWSFLVVCNESENIDWWLYQNMDQGLQIGPGTPIYSSAGARVACSMLMIRLYEK